MLALPLNFGLDISAGKSLFLNALRINIHFYNITTYNYPE